MEEYLELIKAHPAFEGITQDEDILWLRKCMDAEIHNYKRGETIFREGEQLLFASILLKGKALAVFPDGKIEIKEAGSFLFTKEPTANSLYAPYTLLSDSDITVFSMRVLRLAKLCSFRCEFHGKLLDNIKKFFY